MGYAPFPITEFGGLDLRSEADSSSGAIDLENVMLDKPGAVRTRYGSKLFATPSSAATVLRMKPFYHTAGDQLLAHFTTASAGKVTAFSSVGAAVATQTMNSSTSVCDFASIGTPGAQRAYVCDSGGLMYRWDGAAFTQVAGSPKCSYVAATADGRLCAANISTVPTGSGATASSSLVHFSDPGAPETWSANNYVYLSPGDGDAITSVVAWQNLLFVFKRFKFFVFDSTSTDGSGNPVFNYRTIDSKAAPQTAFSACASPEGVYFISTDGVYLTTGFAPRKVSTPLDPFFTGDTSAYWTGSTVGNDLWGDGTDATNVWGDGTNPALRWGDGASGDMRLAYAANQLYVFRKGREDMFVLDTETNQWTYWTLPLATHSLTGFQYGGAGAEVLLVGQTTKIVRMDRTATDDTGTAISARYRSGYISLNWIRRQRQWIPVADQEATVRETILDGIGSIYYSLSRDWAVEVPTSGGGARSEVVLTYTNLVSNPSFEIDTSSWIAGSSTLTRSTTWSYVGTASGRWVGDAALDNVRTTTAGTGVVTVGQSYTAQFRLNVTTNSGTFKPVIYWWTSGGVYISTTSGTTVTTTGEMQVSVTGTAPATAAYGTPGLEQQASGAVDLYLDAVMLTRGTVVRRYVAHTSASVAQGRHRLAQRGRALSFQIESVDGPWRVEDLVLGLTGVRQPGVLTS